ncbi:carbohydrate sulfotransferase 1-like [Convolutriloba macropyga]|uniref:carbohydrate sulfotransferase 1-like n=1 Tax=Convolutriloba macropyga TaxID=536237 RepID=UPI003F526F69
MRLLKIRIHLYFYCLICFSISGYFFYLSSNGRKREAARLGSLAHPKVGKQLMSLGYNYEYDPVEAELYHAHGHAKQFTTQTKVIILSYMRSGSSLLGKILSSNENSFYIYEPYRLIQRFMEDNGPRTYDTIKKKDFFVIQKEWTKKLLNCNLKETIFNSSFVESLKRQMLINEYADMLRQSSLILNWDEYFQNDTLIKKEEKKCKKSKLLILKTIRIHSLEQLWPTIQTDVRIVHLLRDPRAVQNSRLKLRRNSGPRWVCEWPANNLDFIQKLSEKDVFLFTRYYEFIYEEFASHPMKKVSHLFEKFLKIRVDSKIEKLVYESTQKGGDYFGNFKTTSRNISQIVGKWKSELSYGERTKIEDSPICQNVMNYVGYEWPLVSYALDTKHIS